CVVMWAVSWVDRFAQSVRMCAWIARWTPSLLVRPRRCCRRGRCRSGVFAARRRLRRAALAAFRCTGPLAAPAAHEVRILRRLRDRGAARRLLARAALRFARRPCGAPLLRARRRARGGPDRGALRRRLQFLERLGDVVAER